MVSLLVRDWRRPNVLADPGVTLVAFVRESNLIEGIRRDPTDSETLAHQELLREREMSVGALERFVADVASRPLRDTVGMDVRVGSHLPPLGGPHIRSELTALVLAVNDGRLDAFAAHVAYETLHPFLDGNGRSGRAMWAWQMRRDGQDPFALSFLHRFYYQSLDASASRGDGNTEPALPERGRHQEKDCVPAEEGT